jgi:hypothetical protein
MGGHAVKVIFDFNASRLAIEGDGPDLLKVIEAARNLAPSLAQINVILSANKNGTDENVGSPAERPAARGGKTLREFARSLTLDNAAERIAAIAYYVNKIEGKQSFSPKELDGWFTMCGFQKPQQMPVALFDTKRKYGYAENVGRGMWRVSNQGENLIIRKIEESAEKGS